MVSEKSDGAYNVVCVLTEDPLLEPLGTKLTDREDANWYLADGVYSLCFYDDENKKIVLHPENEKYRDIAYDELEVQGVAVHVIKNLS